MDGHSTLVGRHTLELSQSFGLLIRSRRKALNMTQDQLALATGVGRRFLIDLEAGKTTCRLGLSLLVAQALGLRPPDIVRLGQSSGASDIPELPSPLGEDLEREARANG
jgi:transcriptional regulator with XRE-family HTH domain